MWAAGVAERLVGELGGAARLGTVRFATPYLPAQHRSLQLLKALERNPASSRAAPSNCASSGSTDSNVASAASSNCASSGSTDSNVASVPFPHPMRRS